jgi:hypothetical protein
LTLHIITCFRAILPRIFSSPSVLLSHGCSSQKYIGQIIAASLDSWREKTHSNENMTVQPLHDSLFHVPSMKGGAAAVDCGAAAAADADSTMAIVARALDVLSSARFGLYNLFSLSRHSVFFAPFYYLPRKLVTDLQWSFLRLCCDQEFQVKCLA